MNCIRSKKGKCELCRAALDRFSQADHAQGLRQSATEQVNDTTNLRLLCVACHTSATSPVAQAVPAWDPLASWTADRRFMDSPRPKQIITKLKALDERQQMQLIDVKRCRRNICRNSAWEIPAISFYDEFFRVTAETNVADFTCARA